MKLTIELDLKDIWAEGETLNEAIVSDITYKVKEEVWSLVRKQVTESISQAVANEVNTQAGARISAHIDDFLANGMLSPMGHAPIKIIDYLHNIISDTRAWQNLGSNLTKVAENFAKDVQQKYDVLFATNIVMKLKDNGMLDQAKLNQLFGEN